MFSFFKRLIGKSTDSDSDVDTDTPEENEAGDVAEARSAHAGGLQHAGTPATVREGVAASDRASEAPLRGIGSAEAAPIGNEAPAGTTPPASSASLSHATAPVTPAQPVASTATVVEPTRTEAPGVAAAGTPTPATQASPVNTSPAATTTPETKPYWQGRTTSQWKAPAETVEIVPPPEPEASAKRSWLTRLKTGLSKTSSGLTGIFIGARIDEDLYEELETALLMSDAGVDATEYLLEALREKVRSERLTDSMQVKAALRSLLADLLRPLEKSLMLGRAQPLVMMIAGVNGAGKTTSIGKLAKHLQRFDQSVLLAAGDTFRAAAREQLTVWGQRNNVTVMSQESGDAAAVIFDAVGAARARKIDVMMADTAGRLPTQLHLMEELRKVKRVIAKAQPDAPHEVLLVIDANTGQNALAQVKSFDDALGLTGLIVTKLDGTAKGGILAAIARQRPIPVYFIGVGEKVEDLQPFSADEFADALLGN